MKGHGAVQGGGGKRELCRAIEPWEQVPPMVNQPMVKDLLLKVIAVQWDGLDSLFGG